MYLDSLIWGQCVSLSGESLQRFGQNCFSALNANKILNCEMAESLMNNLIIIILSKVQCMLCRQQIAVVGQHLVTGVKKLSSKL